MEVVVDTSALIAVLLSEPQRDALVRVTEGVSLVAPASVHWEVGKALSAFLKRHRVTLTEAKLALATYESVPIRFIDVDLVHSVELAADHGLYAYDAYLVACALAQRAPLLTLDSGLKREATAAGVDLVEVEMS